MATKTIVSTVTLHVEGPAFKPFSFSDSGITRDGKYDVTEAAPGTPVELDAAEADRLIARGIAEIYVAPTPAAAPAPIAAPDANSAGAAGVDNAPPAPPVPPAPPAPKK